MDFLGIFTGRMWISSHFFYPMTNTNNNLLKFHHYSYIGYLEDSGDFRILYRYKDKQKLVMRKILIQFCALDVKYLRYTMSLDWAVTGFLVIG